MSLLEKHYILTPLESILINKLMPKGFKLETENNLSLSAPLSSLIPKEQKNNDSILNNKCDIFIKKILSNDISQEFYNRNNNEPCILTIERNIKNNKYEEISECYDDLKKMFKYYLNNYKNDKDIYNKISKLSDFSEKIFKSIQNNIIKENLEKAVNIDNNNPMKLDEKKTLGENIKKLNVDQLTGIIKIIQEHSTLNKDEKYLEFDIDKLSNKKCRELETYVRACLGNHYIEPRIKDGGINEY